MKNVISILLLFIAIAYNAQPTIISFTPHVVCPGDTICVTLFDKEKIPFYFNIETQSPTEPNILNWQEIYPMGNEPDTIVRCFALPDYLPQGPAMIGVNLESLISMSLACGPTTNVKTALTEHQQNEPESIYFDLQGRQIEKRYNQLMIEQIGTQRRKVVVND